MPCWIPWYRKAEWIASRTRLFPLKEKETLLTPPMICAPGKFSLIHLAALKKSRAFFLCSSIPVATGKMLGSKMISEGSNPASSVRILYALPQISFRRGKVSAWPSSSKAIQMTAAPKRRMILARRRNSSSPSFRLMEFTTPFPCMHFNPARMTSHFEESTIMGILAISGSEAMRFRKCVISSALSNIPSSILTSRIWAPPSTWSSATFSALSYSLFLM